MGSQLNILWLPGWFPSRVDFLDGDFNERYAKAVSEQVPVTVIYVVKDKELRNVKKQIVKEQTGNLTIYRGYYPGSVNENIFNKVNSVIRYLKLLWTLYKIAEKEKGKFHLCHVHVPLRQSILAMWLKRKYKLDYVLSEQNSWYMPGDNNFFRQPFFFRKIIKKTYDKASAIHVVSRSLGEQLNKNICPGREFKIIPNVVNTNTFRPLSRRKMMDTTIVNFVAVTGNTWHKNTDGIIRAFDSFITKGINAWLHIAGPNINDLKTIVTDLGIEKNVHFYGAVSNEEIAMIIQRSDAMLFFTRYETFGCVMAEALCCGIPVIASRLPVLEENLIEKKNGLFVDPENEKDLEEKMNWFMQNRDAFDTVSIAAEASEKYNYHIVALQFLDFYTKVLSK
jgi:glycosyltransferase involved in cell wall biosynthesis